MLFFWILVNIILFSLINVEISVNQWQVISGFNLGFVGGFLGFLLLSFSSKGIFSKVTFKKVLAYFTFLIRILIYGTIIGLAIYFKFFNLFSIIAGFSLLLIAILMSEFLLFKKAKKEKKKC